MTTDIIRKAEKELAAASERYKSECTKKYGRYTDDNDLYCSIVGPAWENYLAAGGSRTMINE